MSIRRTLERLEQVTDHARFITELNRRAVPLPADALVKLKETATVEVIDLFTAFSTSRILVDRRMDDGSGLELFGYEQSVECADELRDFDFLPSDTILGYFTGFSEYLVSVRPDVGAPYVLIADLEISVRQDWLEVGDSVEEFLRTWLADDGRDFWHC